VLQGGQQLVASAEASSLREVASDHESQSGDSEDNETSFDTSTRLKVVAALAGITYDFGQLTMTKTHLGSLSNHGRYFPNGYGQPLTWSLCLSLSRMKLLCSRISLLLGFACPHLVLVDILRKFRVKLHQLMPNAIIQISKFIWGVTSCGAHPTANVFAQHYELHYQNKKIQLAGFESSLAA
jgi:hypothetical protein